MSLDHLGSTFQIKTVDFGQRIIAGWAAYHGNIDRVADIIEPGASQKAVARLKAPSDVGVFVGHDLGRLPVGVPIKIEAHPEGLYTETKVFDGPAGDDLLGAARGLREHGQSLGMSIGYRVHDARPDRVGGKTIRRLTDYSLHEYSFAAPQAIANPAALVVGVKTGDAMTYTVKPMDGKYHVMKGDQSLADFATEDQAQARCDALNKDSGGKTHPNNLPDSAFLYVQPGGQIDDEGKTVPRHYRHFQYRDEAGALDAAALDEAVKAISAADMEDRERSRLYGQARWYRDGQKTVLPAIALDMVAAAYRLMDAASQVETEHKALAVIGEDTDEGRRIRPETRSAVSDVVDSLTRIVTRAELVERGEEGKALTDWWDAQFELLEVAK